MAKQADFNAFLKNIEPSTTTVSYISSIQTNLRDYLKNHESYKAVHIDTFLSGSYAKHTSIRPVVGNKKRLLFCQSSTSLCGYRYEWN